MIIPLILLAFPLFQARTRTLQRTQSIWKQTCWRANYGGRYSAEATLSRGCNDLTQDDMYVAFDFSSSVVSRFLICCAFSVFVFFMWYCGIIFYATTHPVDRAGGIMCLACPSICVCGTYVCTCMCALVEAFSDWLAINFQFHLLCISFYFIHAALCFQCFDTVGWASWRASGL